MLKNLKIGIKLPLVTVLIAVIALALAEVIANSNATETVMAAGSDRLRAVAESRAAEVQRTLLSVRADLRGKHANPVILEAARAFVTSWQLHPGDPRADLRRLYVNENPNPADSRYRLTEPGDRSAYSRVHRRYHPFFVAHLRSRDYADIYLVSPEGVVVYSTAKQGDFGADLRQPAMAGRNLSIAVRRILDGPGDETEVMTGFAGDPETPGVLSAIFATPVRSPLGTTEAVIAMKVATPVLDAITSRPAGLGETGEAYLTDEGGRVLTRLRGAAPAGTAVATGGGHGTATGRVPADAPGVTLVAGPGDGEGTLFASVPVAFMGSRFALVAQQDLSEILAPARSLRAQMVREGMLALSVVALLGVLLARTMSVPLTRVGEAMRRVALKDYAADIPDRRRRDEIGTIANRLDAFRAALAEADGLARENAFKGAAFEAASAAMMLVDRDLTIIYVNARLTELFRRHRIVLDRTVVQFRPEVVVGRSLSAFFPGAERVRDTLADLEHAAEEIRLGQTYLRLDLGPVYGGGNAILGYVVEWRDVSAAHMDRAMLHGVDANLPLASFAPDGRLISGNARFALWTGRLEAGLTGLGWDRIFADEAAAPGCTWRDATRPEAIGRTLSLCPGQVPGDAALAPVVEEDGRLQRYVLVVLATPDPRSVPSVPVAGADEGRIAAGSRR